MHIRLGGSEKIDRRDLWQYSFPTPDEYPSFKVRSLSLSSFIPWDWKEIYQLLTMILVGSVTMLKIYLNTVIQR